MSDTQPQPQYSLTEEFLHAFSHGAGAILSIGGLTWMLYISIAASDPWRIVASIVYGLSLVLLFMASTLYHTFHSSSHKHVFKLLDHCAIYLLIAGTYTPFLLVAMRTNIGWWLFGIVWALATAGILTKLWFRHRFPRVSLVSYLLMGWLVVIIIPQVAEAIGKNGILWLAAGGASYTVGAFFYAQKQMAYSHVIWHVFVLVGSICHFLAIAWHVLPVTQEFLTSS
jgi:hemolysin III